MKISKKIMIALYMVGVGLSFNLTQGGLVDKVQAQSENDEIKSPKPKLTFLCKAPETGNANAYISGSEGFTPVAVSEGDYLFRVLNGGNGDMTSYEIKLGNTLVYTGGVVIAGGHDFFTINTAKAGLNIYAHPSGSHGTASTNEKQICEMLEPSPEPTPTPTSNDEVSYKVLDVKCGSDTVSASVHVKHDNIDQSGIRVLFKYIDQEKIAYTGNDGQASVGFPYIVDGHVDILPDGFPSKQGFTTKEKNCEITETPSEGQVLGASTGEVLGAYAETGVAEDILMSLVGFSGAALTATGAVLNARKNS